MNWKAAQSYECSEKDGILDIIDENSVTSHFSDPAREQLSEVFIFRLLIEQCRAKAEKLMPVAIEIVKRLKLENRQFYISNIQTGLNDEYRVAAIITDKLRNMGYVGPWTGDRMGSEIL